MDNFRILDTDAELKECQRELPTHLLVAMLATILKQYLESLLPPSVVKETEVRTTWHHRTCDQTGETACGIAAD